MGVERVPSRGDGDAALDDRAIRVLAFEGRAWQQPGLKAQAIPIDRPG